MHACADALRKASAAAMHARHACTVMGLQRTLRKLAKKLQTSMYNGGKLHSVVFGTVVHSVWVQQCLNQDEEHAFQLSEDSRITVHTWFTTWQA